MGVLLIPIRKKSQDPIHSPGVGRRHGLTEPDMTERLNWADDSAHPQSFPKGRVSSPVLRHTTVQGNLEHLDISQNITIVYSCPEEDGR